MSDFPPAMPHGALEEVFTDVFVVTGTVRPLFEGKQWQFSRNMTVVREGQSLTLINTVRLDDAGLAALDALGTVRHVVKLGQAHGLDDPFYMDRYDAALWALPDMTHNRELSTDKQLTAGGEMPFSGCSLIDFEVPGHPESALLVERDGGILITCDSLQNWAQADEYFSEESAALMGQYGFFRPANIGPGWLRAAKPGPQGFQRVLASSFKHLLSSHGTPLRESAHEQLAATFKEILGI